MEEQTSPPAEEKTAEAAAPEAPKISVAQRKKMRDQQKQLASMFQKFNEKQAVQRQKLREEANRMRLMLGKEDYKTLRDICTIHTPEQKNEKGEVTAKATSFLNRKALLSEGRLILALKREQRIAAGQRKRSTGSSSARKAHRATINFIHMRDAETLKQETLKP